MPQNYSSGGKLVLASIGALWALSSQSHAQEEVRDFSLQAQTNFARQVASITSIKKSLTSAQKKLSSPLLHALPSKRAVYRKALPQMQFEEDVDATTTVDIHTKVTSRVLIAIAKVGGKVLNSFPNDDTIRATLSPSGAEQLAALPEVRYIEPAAEPVFFQEGRVTTQGDVAHKADVARENFKVRGAGIKIGVLSDSVDFLSDSQLSRDLGKVTVLKNQSGKPATGEGTAMLEIIHDLAPDAQLYFATGLGGPAGMADNIRELKKAGCNIIVDDISYYQESVFQEDVVSAAIREVSQAGVLYFTSAGNLGNKTGGISSYWEGDFVDGGKTADYNLGNDDTRIHKFGSSTFNEVLKVGKNKRCLLQWSSPYNSAKDDYDLWLVDSQGFIKDVSDTIQDGSTPPIEAILVPAAPGDKVIITRYSGKTRYLSLLMDSGCSLSQFTAGSCRGHNAAEFAISVAAAPFPTSFLVFTKPFDTQSVTETYSSDGPRRLFYNPDGTSRYRVLQKPDMTAADGVRTNVPGFSAFSGTSAAAPHAAAIAALVWSANPALTAASIRKALNSSAIDIMAPKTDSDSGIGIVMAYDAVRAAMGMKAPKADGPSGGSG